MGAAKAVHAGFGGKVLAAAVGSGLGLCCAWTMRVVGEVVASKLQRNPNWPDSPTKREEQLVLGLHLGAIVWMLLNAVLAAWASLRLLRHLG